MIDLLTALSERFDLVILDTPPVSVVPDAIPLMRLVTGVVIVARKNVITRDAARQLRDQLTNLRAPTLGVVANAMPANSARYPRIRLYGAVGRERAHPDTSTSPGRVQALALATRAVGEFPPTGLRHGRARSSARRGSSNVPARSLTPNLIVLADARHARLALVGGGLALISAYILVHRSASLALALAALPLLVWTLLRPSRGLGIGLVLTLAVPYWWSFGGRHAYQYAAVLAAVSVLSARRLRLTLIDVALLTYTVVYLLGWILQYDHPETVHIALGEVIPLGFYLGARAIPHRRFTAFMTLTLFAGTVGALTVIYEFARGHPIFTDPTKYLWNTLPGGLFRPGGIFGSPPGAATILMYVLFFGLAGLRSLRGKARALGAICMGDLLGSPRADVH